MCNINAVVKPKGVDCTASLSHSSAVSFVKNSDGEGVFFSCDNTIVKSKDKLDLSLYRDRITASECVIVHERLASSGFSEEYLHPFSDDRWVLVHNGVFCDVGFHVSQRSDTFYFFQKFVKNFNHTGKMQEAIDKTVKDMGWGSYSIFIYDKQEKKAYYFKESSMDMTCFSTFDGAKVFSTSGKNLMFWDFRQYEQITDDTLYSVSVRRNEVRLQQVAKLESAKPFRQVYHEEGYDAQANNDQLDNFWFPKLPAKADFLDWLVFALAFMFWACFVLPFALFFGILGLLGDFAGWMQNIGRREYANEAKRT